MDKSTVKNIVVFGLLFLVGLMILSVFNFLAFSPATPGVLATAAVATKQYQDIDPSLISVQAQRIKCREGSQTCEYRKPQIILVVESRVSVKISFRSQFIDQYNQNSSVWCGQNYNLVFGVSVDPLSKTTLTCEEIPLFWEEEAHRYAPPNHDPTITSPVSICIKVRNELRSIETTICESITETNP